MEAGSGEDDFNKVVEEQLLSLKQKLVLRYEQETRELRAEIGRLREQLVDRAPSEKGSALRRAGEALAAVPGSLLALQGLPVPGVPDSATPCASSRANSKSNNGIGESVNKANKGQQDVYEGMPGVPANQDSSPCSTARGRAKNPANGMHGSVQIAKTVRGQRSNVENPESRQSSKEGSARSPRCSPRSRSHSPRSRSRSKEPVLLEQREVDDIRELRRLHDEREERMLNNVYVQARYALRVVQRVTTLKDAKRFEAMREATHRIISSPIFDSLIGCIIISHSACIGIETSYTVANDTNTPPVAIAVLDKVFLMIYIVELGMRFFAGGILESLRSHWVKFDTFLVVSSILDLIVSTLPGGSLPGLDDIMLIRVLRVFRLARTVRLMVQFRTLWMLVQGLMHSIMTLLWTLLIIMILCYIFAILGMELFARNPHEYGEVYQEVVTENFGNMIDAMITMFQFLTLDSVGSIHRPIVRERPFVAGTYFIAFVLLTPIALMNLVTAVMVESSLNQSNQDQEARRAWEAQKRKQLLPKLTRLFEQLDEDNSGEVDLDEIHGANEVVKDQMRAICNGGDLDDIFHQLDYDNSGSVSIDEFCEGLLKAGGDKPVEFHCIMRQCNDIVGNTRKSLAILEDRFKTQNDHDDRDDSVKVIE